MFENGSHLLLVRAGQLLGLGAISCCTYRLQLAPSGSLAPRHPRLTHHSQVDVDTEKGGLSLNNDFFVDFGAEPGGLSSTHVGSVKRFGACA